MNHSLLVRCLQRFANLDAEVERLRGFYPTLSDSLGQRLPFHILHHQKLQSFRFPHVIDGCNVGVIQGGGCPGFPLKPLQPLRVPDQFRRQNLQRHNSLQAGVASPVDLPHPTRCQQFYHLVRPQPLACRQRLLPHTHPSTQHCRRLTWQLIANQVMHFSWLAFCRLPRLRLVISGHPLGRRFGLDLRRHVFFGLGKRSRGLSHRGPETEDPAGRGSREGREVSTGIPSTGKMNR